MAQRDVVDDIKPSRIYAISSDSSTGMAGIDVDAQLLSKEHFTRLYNPPESIAATLAASIKDVLVTLTLSMEDLRGHCFDGAANMSGRLHGVQEVIRDEQPKSHYIHCGNHALDLALQENDGEHDGNRDSSARYEETPQSTLLLRCKLP
ncbi:hypothetical protein HPB49_022880 [Dermacentor silvarum]|uniref:Uncharacterized protein n=1 Tax=Dermacentor silvarum TaxID=543639 RepID=A0ACB8CBW9_DERSI|nr:hypothetical protein HPB49_022880 [Dermacentor silvarum]